MLQLSQYDLKAGTPKAVKIQAIEDLLALFPREKQFPLDDKVPREVATIEVAANEWVMKFDGSYMMSSRGTKVVPYHREGETMALSFKLEFSCSNNTAEYEAYLTGLVTTLEMEIQHLRVVSDSNLVVCQAKGSFSLKELALAPYKTLAQRMEENFCTFEIEHS